MKTIAVVGMSPKPERPSHYVAMYLIENGYEVIPVNPGHKEIAGITSYPSLLDIPKIVDVVDVFRRPEHVLLIAEAADLAEKAGLLVVMNDCMLRRHRQAS